MKDDTLETWSLASDFPAKINLEAGKRKEKAEEEEVGLEKTKKKSY
jgi:hypothetical protein